jgi:DNA polymerase-1
MSEPRKKLILIDGHGLAYRQFHGLPMDKFTTMSGEPTNAVWGFARSLLDILQAPNPPEYLAVAFDQGLSGRETVYTDYKANREEMADSLAKQIERIRELVQAFNIPIVEKEGYEADDVIGSVAQQVASDNVHVHIVTGDRDLMQLVGDNVTLELPTPPAQVRQAGVSQMYDTARVIERFGVRPDQFVDYKGFVGDTSDNIPGVRGIGEKTATSLLQKYGTMEGIYEHLDEIKGSQHDKLEQGRENAFLSRDLSRIMLDIPLDFDLDKCVAHDYDPQKVAQLFKALEFRSLANRLQLPSTEPAPAPAPSGQMSLFDTDTPAAPEVIKQVVNTIVVDTPEALADLVNVLANGKYISFDTETTSTEQMRADLVGISLAVDGETGYYIPVGHKTPDGIGEPPQQLAIDTVIEALRPALTDPHKPKWAQNAVYDLIILRRYGLDVTPITFDTMLAEFLINADSRRGLKDQAEHRLGVNMTHIEELIGRGKGQITMDRVSIERAAPYAAADAAITYRLVEPLEQDLKKPLEGSKNKLWELFNEVEMPLVAVIGDLDMNGAKIDQPYLRELSKDFNGRLGSIAERIYEQAGEVFKIGSLKQLNDILFNKLNLPTKGLSKSMHGYSIDSDALESLEQYHPIVREIIEWRTLEKLRSTYVDALQSLVDSEGRIHTSYNQTGAVTGRVSSDSPNLQNIPIRTEEGRRVRRAFIAPPGCHLLSVDYSQIELRILASFSGDPFLREAFIHDQDVHRATAAAVFNIPFDSVTKEQRYLAKRVNFGLMYGMGAHRLARESGLSMAESQQFIERYFQRFPSVKQYFDGSKQRAEEYGYLETLLGRRRYFPLLHKTTGLRGAHVQRARAEREAINMPVQGTAADIMKLAMIEVSARLKAEKPNARLILQVHDELVLEVPDDEIIETAALVLHVMENVVQLDEIGLRADAQVGLNWAEMQPIEEYSGK